MKRISEVTKIVGVTRRTLQEYDKIGLFHPTAKTEGGYWLYDDNAIRVLIMIRVFVEAGYERQQIKQFLESPAPDIIVEFEHMISTLEEKKKRISNTIELLNSIRNQIISLPKSTLIALGSVDFSILYREMSFSEHLEKALSSRVEMTDADREESIKLLLFWSNLMAVCVQKNKSPDDPSVQKCVISLLNSFVQIMLDYNFETDEEKEKFRNVSQQVMEKQLEREIRNMLDDREFLSELEQECHAVGVAPFIQKAVQALISAKMWVYDKDKFIVNKGGLRHGEL